MLPILRVHKVARSCSPAISGIDDEEMNFVYLKTPIGSNKFVESYLEKKLTRLKMEVNLLSEMTHLHESLLYYAAVRQHAR